MTQPQPASRKPTRAAPGRPQHQPPVHQVGVSVGEDLWGPVKALLRSITAPTDFELRGPVI